MLLVRNGGAATGHTPRSLYFQKQIRLHLRRHHIFLYIPKIDELIV